MYVHICCQHGNSTRVFQTEPELTSDDGNFAVVALLKTGIMSQGSLAQKVDEDRRHCPSLQEINQGHLQ